MTQTLERSAPADAAAGYRWRWPALFVVLLAEIMDLVDSTVVSVAAPSIRTALGGGLTALQWIAAGYTLAFAVGLITGGRLGDIYGRKRIFLIGVVGFVVASALCGTAQSMGMLVVFRVLQGAFAAVMIPQAFGIIKQMFPPHQLGAAFAVFGPVMGLAAVGGPILGGALADTGLFGLGWRSIFLINIPIGLLVLLAAMRLLPESRSPQRTRLDPIGMLLVGLATVLLIYPLVQGRELDWPMWTFFSMAASPLVFLVFGWQQRSKQRRDGSPLIVPTLFRNSAFTGGLAVGLVFFAAMMGFLLVFGLYTQLGLGYSPLRAGMAMVPFSLATAVGAGISGTLAAKAGRKMLQIGMVVMIVGAVGLFATLSLAGDRPGFWQMAPAVAVFGLGIGLVMAPYFDIVLAGVDNVEVGSASGTLSATQQLGFTVGVAVVATAFFSWADGGFTPAMRQSLWIVIGLSVVAFMLSFLLPRGGSRELADR